MGISRKLRRKVFKVAVILGGILAYNNARVRNEIKKKALTGFKRSAWRFLYQNADEGSFLSITGFTREAFDGLVDELESTDETHLAVKKAGRPFEMDYHGRVGLVLMFHGSRMRLKDLSLIFGLVPSVLSRNLSYMTEHAVRVLKYHPFSRIKFPNETECKRYAELICGRQALVEDVVAFMDGLSTPIKCSSEPSAQADNHNAYKQDTNNQNNCFPVQ